MAIMAFQQIDGGRTSVEIPRATLNLDSHSIIGMRHGEKQVFPDIPAFSASLLKKTLLLFTGTSNSVFSEIASSFPDVL